ncbi:MAG: putative spermidine/putrescine transport system permease protein [Trebonia sp.]|nr:putative spermidine/putrescine transport system permease protein [Trebonia sp.]
MPDSPVSNSTGTVTAPGSLAGPGAGRIPSRHQGLPAPARAVARAIARYAGILPFTVYVVLGLVIPMIAVAVGAFQDPDTGGWTLHNIDLATHGVYLTGFRESIILSVLAAVLPAVFGLLIAYAISTARGRGGAVLRQVTITASGVFANFGGVPLAFLFITTLGSSGLETQWLKDIGWDIYAGGFSLYSVTGIVVVYMYFQIPLMVLVILPALEGLKPAWREAAENLGARSWGYWRYVGGPVLMPAVLGSMLLLFGFGLSAYATAQALTSGTIPLTSIQIGSFLSGNVIAGQQNVGKALGLGMVVIIAVVMVFYILLQRRAAKWLR